MIQYTIIMVYDIDCVILAAGISSRMKEWKMTMPFAQSTIAEYSIRNALKVCKRVILVAGYKKSELIKMFGASPGIQIVENDQYRNGMISSVKKGVEAVKTKYFFIMHADLPLVSPDIYNTLIKYRGDRAVFPVHRKRRGHPVLLPDSLIPAILEEKNKTSVWDILYNYPKQFVEVESPSIYRDIDTEEDYRSVLNDMRNNV